MTLKRTRKINNYQQVLREVIGMVKDACKTEDRWRYHIFPVVEYGKLLSKKFNADKEIVELACWLHDFTRITGDVENHHVTSAIAAKKILEGLNFDEEKTKMIADCVYAHRGSVNVHKKNIEEKIVACADAMSHFEFRIILFYSAFGRKNMSLENGVRWIDDKIERSWKKISIPFARELVREKYVAMKEILNFMEPVEFSRHLKNIAYRGDDN